MMNKKLICIVLMSFIAFSFAQETQKTFLQKTCRIIFEGAKKGREKVFEYPKISFGATCLLLGYLTYKTFKRPKYPPRYTKDFVDKEFNKLQNHYKDILEMKDFNQVLAQVHVEHPNSDFPCFDYVDELSRNIDRFEHYEQYCSDGEYVNSNWTSLKLQLINLKNIFMSNQVYQGEQLRREAKLQREEQARQERELRERLDREQREYIASLMPKNKETIIIKEKPVVVHDMMGYWWKRPVEHHHHHHHTTVINETVKPVKAHSSVKPSRGLFSRFKSRGSRKTGADYREFMDATQAFFGGPFGS